ncbi:DgyrCDS72 [Dimorphilus gyrociliatus]|uniref:Inositol oxygenase n=1 Tax=Dimorphilus gyrociliatus TaxID=2664684 RepID=A0A7I8V520_9ANNE|nr:DgyrCDS72 [Dimorphilus gyrociliatus]
MAVQPLNILDPSDKFRPEKDESLFRDYTNDNSYFDRVKRVYYSMHTTQTLQFATEKLQFWSKLNKAQLPILQALDLLNNLVDDSDPDVDIPNSVHAFQTAERIREVHPDKPWFQLIGLIHDVGKVLALWGEPQYSVVGDTFPLGCAFSDKIVFGTDSFKDNPDLNHSVYREKLGIYKENCGLSNVIMSWGHDEYLYRVLLQNGSKLPNEALQIIRFHSFYPWHTEGEYMHLCDESDKHSLEWVKEFNKFDLYSKSDEVPKVEEIKPYYESLIKEYLPPILRW